MKNLVYKILFDNAHSVEFNLQGNNNVGLLIDMYNEENIFIGSRELNDEDRKELIDYLQKADEYIDSYKE